MKMKKKIIAAFVGIALTCGFCGCNGGNEDISATTANVESDTAITTTEATTAETSAATEETETETEETTETSETAEATEESSQNAEGLTVSPSGYVLDPEITLGDEYAWQFPENQPCLIGEPIEGVRFYGVNAGEERAYKYTQPAFGEYEYDQYIIIEHDGIAEEFAGLWGERFGTVMPFYSADFDGDGETEIATERYSVGGPLCCVMELAVYKLKDGHYERFLFDLQSFNNEYITVSIDNEKRVLTLLVNGFDKTFIYDFSEVVPPEMTEFKVTMVQVNDFICDGGEITYIVTPLIMGYVLETFVDINFKLKFSDGVFTCSDVEFIEEKPAGRSDDPEYAVDFDTAVSNIIAAGVEANNSKFVLSGTENSDGETYYMITKGFDNGDKVVTEEIFRVNTENGSVYVLFDPTLPMSDFLAQFKSENDENDPRSRYIQIYDGKL